MASIDVPLTKRGFGKTARKDQWWVYPLMVFLGYMSFIIYATWAGLAGNHYLCTTACGGADYLSPMYSPLLLTSKPVLVASHSAVFRSDADPVGARRLPVYLLLLSRRVLQSVLGRSTELLSGRAAQQLLGRKEVSADHAKRPSLLPLYRDPIRFHSFL